MDIIETKYTLYLKWNCVELTDNYYKVTGAYFTGPVTSDVVKLNEKDSIRLDFYSQYFVLSKSIFIGNFEWNGVSYRENKILLNNTYLRPSTLSIDIPKLSDTDYIFIDTRDHKEESHIRFPMYKCVVCNGKTKDTYNFKEKVGYL